jgi:hypothetical protein
MGGAIFSHLTKLGIASGRRRPWRAFALAVLVFVCSAAVLFLHRELPARSISFARRS